MRWASRGKTLGVRYVAERRLGFLVTESDPGRYDRTEVKFAVGFDSRCASCSIFAMRRLAAAEVAQVAQRYLAGESSRAIADCFGVSDVAVLNWLKKLGVSTRNASEARRLYPVWDEAFAKLTPESAYWIGFLMADGCVHDESKVSVGLSQTDAQHLYKLRSFLRCEERPVYRVVSNRSYQFKVHSRQIVSDLRRYGVIPRKSLVAKAKAGVDAHPSFWLGVLDGDGCIGISRGRLRVRFAGAQALMQQLVRFLAENQVRGRNSTFNVGITKGRNGLCEVAVLGQRAANLLRLLYESSPVYLARKHQRFLQVQELVCESP